MSDTPRTDALADLCSTDSEHTDLQAYAIMRSGCEKLERELTAAQSRNDELKTENKRMREAVAKLEARLVECESALRDINNRGGKSVIGGMSGSVLAMDEASTLTQEVKSDEK